jgi:hypothetical protein
MQDPQKKCQLCQENITSDRPAVRCANCQDDHAHARCLLQSVRDEGGSCPSCGFDSPCFYAGISQEGEQSIVGRVHERTRQRYADAVRGVAERAESAEKDSDLVTSERILSDALQVRYDFYGGAKWLVQKTRESLMASYAPPTTSSSHPDFVSVSL